jgi:hypothetical protein
MWLILLKLYWTVAVVNILVGGIVAITDYTTGNEFIPDKYSTPFIYLFFIGLLQFGVPCLIMLVVFIFTSIWA